MAITQISKIQVRTGNIADLPQLSPGELGWADDERRLFIGNDANRASDNPSTPNNTEIFTAYSTVSATSLRGTIDAMHIYGGRSGQILSTLDGNGTLAWVDQSAGGGGAGSSSAGGSGIVQLSDGNGGFTFSTGFSYGGNRLQANIVDATSLSVTSTTDLLDKVTVGNLLIVGTKSENIVGLFNGPSAGNTTTVVQANGVGTLGQSTRAEFRAVAPGASVPNGNSTVPASGAANVGFATFGIGGPNFNATLNSFPAAKSDAYLLTYGNHLSTGTFTRSNLVLGTVGAGQANIATGNASVVKIGASYGSNMANMAFPLTVGVISETSNAIQAGLTTIYGNLNLSSSVINMGGNSNVTLTGATVDNQILIGNTDGTIRWTSNISNGTSYLNLSNAGDITMGIGANTFNITNSNGGGYGFLFNGNLNISGTLNFGKMVASVGELSISGADILNGNAVIANNQFLKTNQTSGLIEWGTPLVTAIYGGGILNNNSNIVAINSGNINVSSAGTTPLVVGSNLVDITGNLTVTSPTNTSVTLDFNSGNFVGTNSNLSFTGNGFFGTAASNVTMSAGVLTTTGNANVGGNLNVSGTIPARGANTYIQYNNAGLLAGSALFRFNNTGSGTLTVGSGGNISTMAAGVLSGTGALTYNSITSNTTVAATGNITTSAGNIAITGGTGSFRGNGGGLNNLQTANLVGTVNHLVTASIATFSGEVVGNIVTITLNGTTYQLMAV